MSKINKYLMTGLSVFLISPTLLQAQIIDGEVTSGFADRVGLAAGFSQGITLGYIISTLISAFLSLIALIFIILIILAGTRWMNSAGNEEAIKKAQETIKNSLIGLIIVLAAWAITYFIFTQLPFGGVTGSGSQGGTSG